MKSFLVLFICLFTFYFSWSQQKILTGNITEKGNNLPLSGVTIVIKNTQRGVISDMDGAFEIEVSQGDILLFTYIGFEPTTYEVGTEDQIRVQMTPGLALGEVVLVGSRTPPRSKTETALPIDVIQGNTELKRTGQATFDKAL